MEVLVEVVVEVVWRDSVVVSGSSVVFISFFGFFSSNSLMISLELIRSFGTISAMATVRRSNLNILN